MLSRGSALIYSVCLCVCVCPPIALSAGCLLCTCPELMLRRWLCALLRANPNCRLTLCAQICVPLISCMHVVSSVPNRHLATLVPKEFGDTEWVLTGRPIVTPDGQSSTFWACLPARTALTLHDRHATDTFAAPSKEVKTVSQLGQCNTDVLV